jgi:hypothetical protein
MSYIKKVGACMAEQNLLSLKQASLWATEYIGREVTTANISYLVQYGRVEKINTNGSTQVYKHDLERYYESYNGSRETIFKEKLGNDLNWALSFEQYKESETTKHVHRLHPYKGKFIPQLVEYFLDDKTDKFKTQSYFSPGDIVLDPFSGSGTTMVQASELGLHAIGIDISAFNSLIGNAKIGYYDYNDVNKEIARITIAIESFTLKSRILEFEDRLLAELNKFNYKYFPVPQYKYQLRNKEIDEKKYGTEKEKLFLPRYEELVKQYNIQLHQSNNHSFLDKWYFQHTRDEIDFVFERIKEIQCLPTKKIVSIILSRTIRSCRATTHADLATLIDPISSTYYCSKHGKICKPIFSILKWWKTYTKYTINRLKQFEKLRTNTIQLCLTGDSRTIDIYSEVAKRSQTLGKLLDKQKIKGIFSSPPYVGLIDYHEQHAYAYDLYGFERNDESEIGPLFKGQNKEAQKSYIQGISDVLNNCKQYLAEDYDIFLVANDKYNMYPCITEKAGMRIVNQFKRPVLNRTEKDKNAYSESIFHLKGE